MEAQQTDTEPMAESCQCMAKPLQFCKAKPPVKK